MVLHYILQYDPCSCKASGCCKLKPSTRSLLKHALETSIAILLGIAIGLPFAILIIILLLIKNAIGTVKHKSI